MVGEFNIDENYYTKMDRTREYPPHLPRKCKLMKLYLGIIYQISIVDHKLYPRSHRSVLKILLNPILRILGFQINSIHDGYNVTGIELMKLDKLYLNLVENYKSSLFYDFDESTMAILKKRIWF